MSVSFSAEATLSALSIDGSSAVKSEPACPDDMYETSQVPQDVYETSQLPRYTEMKTELPEDIEVDVENHSPMPNNQSHDTQVDKYVEQIMKRTHIRCAHELMCHTSQSLSIVSVSCN